MPAADITHSSKLTEKQIETTPYGKTLEQSSEHQAVEYPKSPFPLTQSLLKYSDLFRVGVANQNLPVTPFSWHDQINESHYQVIFPKGLLCFSIRPKLAS
jgi:hypothetical protein